MRRTAKQLLAEYGTVAVVVYFAIFFAVLVGSWAAIRLGWRPTGAAGAVGTWTAAYVATKVAQPLRIAATVALTPLVARAYERVAARLGWPSAAGPEGGADAPSTPPRGTSGETPAE